MCIMPTKFHIISFSVIYLHSFVPSPSNVSYNSAFFVYKMSRKDVYTQPLHTSALFIHIFGTACTSGPYLSLHTPDFLSSFTHISMKCRSRFISLNSTSAFITFRLLVRARRLVPVMSQINPVHVSRSVFNSYTVIEHLFSLTRYGMGCI